MMSFSFSEPDEERVLQTVTVTGSRAQSEWEQNLIADSIQRADHFEFVQWGFGGGGRDAREDKERRDKKDLENADKTPAVGEDTFDYKLKKDYFLDKNGDGIQQAGEGIVKAGSNINIQGNAHRTADEQFTRYYELMPNQDGDWM